MNKARETIWSYLVYNWIRRGRQYGRIWFTIEKGAGDNMVVFGLGLNKARETIWSYLVYDWIRHVRQYSMVVFGLQLNSARETIWSYLVNDWMWRRRNRRKILHPFNARQLTAQCTSLYQLRTECQKNIFGSPISMKCFLSHWIMIFTHLMSLSRSIATLSFTERNKKQKLH